MFIFALIKMSLLPTNLFSKVGSSVPNASGGNFKGKVILVIIAITIILLGRNTLSNATKAMKQNLGKDEESNETIIQNHKIASFSYGLGWGFLVYSILSTFMSPIKLIMVSFIIATMAGITISSFSELDDKCQEKIEYTYSLMYSFMGASVGLFSASIFIMLLNKMSLTSTMVVRVFALFFMTIILFLCSVDINTYNNTKDNYVISRKTSMWVLIITVLLMTAILASFYFIPV